MWRSHLWQEKRNQIARCVPCLLGTRSLNSEGIQPVPTAPARGRVWLWTQQLFCPWCFIHNSHMRLTLEREEGNEGRNVRNILLAPPLLTPQVYEWTGFVAFPCCRHPCFIKYQTKIALASGYSPYQTNLLLKRNLGGLPWWRSGWESACQCRGHGFKPWSGLTCRGATGPVSHNYWACASGACAPQQERPR